MVGRPVGEFCGTPIDVRSVLGRIHAASLGDMSTVGTLDWCPDLDCKICKPSKVRRKGVSPGVGW